MVRPETTLKGVVTALKESERLPKATTYSIYEIDQDGSQANLRPPIVEITLRDAIDYDEHNTDLVGFETDDDGNEIGFIYESRFELNFELDVWTAEGDQYDPYELGESVRYALYEYDADHVGQPLPDPDDPNTTLDDVVRFELGDGGVRNDLSMTPALRRWRESGQIWYYETINTAEEYGALPFVDQINFPDEYESI